MRRPEIFVLETLARQGAYFTCEEQPWLLIDLDRDF
jgi:hypothetical protein